MIKYKNNINVGTGSVGYEADATSAAPLDSVNEGRIVKSEGRTVKWNQNVVNGDFSNGISRWEVRQGNSAVLSTYDGLELVGVSGISNYSQIRTQDKNFVGGHKYYLTATVKKNDCPITTITVYQINGWSGSQTTRLQIEPSQTYTKAGIIITAVDGYEYLSLIASGIVNDDDNRWYVKDVQVIDLTSIFGAGNEPSTVETFEAWLSENMVEQDYYAYDAGSLVPVTVKGVKRDVGGTTVTNPMPVTTLKDENDVVMFPDGLKSAGSVKDEIDWEHGVAVKRVGVVDLGDLTWVYDSTSGSYPVFYAYINSLSVNGSKLICEKYIARNDGPNWYSFINNDQNGKIGAPSSNRPYVIIQDSAYTAASDFTTAMQGVLLYYELATPVTYHFATHAELKKRMVKIGESVEVDGIEGETVVWNQLVENGDFSNGISSWVLRQGNSAALSTSDGLELVCVSGASMFPQIRTQNKNFVSGNKYYIAATVKKNNCPITTITVRQANNLWASTAATQLSIEASQTYTKAATIITAVENYEYMSFQTVDYVNDDDNRWYIKDVQCFDLTQMFGSGNEPATVEAFESWLSAHGGIKDYYPYCAGELKDKEEGNVRGVTQNPYKSITRSVDLTTLKGKVDGAGEDVVMFPDGMKQAGSVKDEIFVDGGVVKAVKRVGSVDLGELTWSFENSSYFKGVLTDRRYGSHVVNVLCSKYKSASDTSVGSMNDKEVGTSATSSNIFILDSAYTSAADFTTAMQGVMLNYELASPVTYVVNMQGMEMAEVRKVMVGTQKVWEKS